jgi:hypothetical protein
MRDRIIIIIGVLFIAGCALFTFARISAHYSTPEAPGPAFYSVGPLVPTASATTSARPVSTTARPKHTRTVWVTVTAGGTDSR